jgi:hypothetical protein
MSDPRLEQSASDARPKSAPRYIRGSFAPIEGLATLRVGLRYFKLKTPWNGELFSERYGHDKTLAKAFGWRLLLRRLGA